MLRNIFAYAANIADRLPSHAFKPEPTTADVLWMVFNLATGVPVWLCIGIFSFYHLYCAAGNSTTIEGWEKDRVATLVRRGKIKEVSIPTTSLEGLLKANHPQIPPDQIPIRELHIGIFAV